MLGGGAHAYLCHRRVLRPHGPQQHEEDSPSELLQGGRLLRGRLTPRGKLVVPPSKPAQKQPPQTDTHIEQQGWEEAATSVFAGKHTHVYHTRGEKKKNGRETKQVETGRTQSGRCTNSLPSGKRLRLHRRHGRACELHWEQEQRPSAEGVGRGRKKCVCTSTRWGQPAMSANMFACSRLEFSKFNAFLCPLALRPWLDKVWTPARGKRAVSSSCPIPFRRLVHISAHRLQSHRTAHLFDPPRT